MDAFSVQGENYDELEPSVRPHVNRQMSMASRERMRFVEGEFKVSFTAFCRAVMSSDPAQLFAWRQRQHVHPAKEDKFDAFFVAEHFKMFSRQAGRDLDSHDLDTIIWLKKIYDGKIIARDQPLPYRREPANFWKHLLDCEKTVRGVAAVWCMQDPKVVFGFLSRPAAVEVLRNASGKHRAGTFFFRLSNSEPTKLVVVFAKERLNKELAPGVIKAVANNRCTRIETESCPAVQCSVKCQDCDLFCCISCAKVCHKTHELTTVNTMREFCCACRGCKIMTPCTEQKRACWVEECAEPACARGFCENHADRACEALPIQGEFIVEQMLINSFGSLSQFSDFLLSHPDLKTVYSDGSKRVLSREELLGKFDDPYLAGVSRQYSEFASVYRGEMPKGPEGVVEPIAEEDELASPPADLHDPLEEPAVGPHPYL